MLFTVEVKVVDVEGRSLGGTPGRLLKLVYDKYTPVKPLDGSQPRYNLIFGHGTGMNRAIWKYHIETLYSMLHSRGWQLGSVIAVDFANHGDSALANAGRLGPASPWQNNAVDVIAMIKNENETAGDFVNNGVSRNVFVGHSLGGYVALMAAYYAPGLFHAIIPIEPVCYMNLTSFGRYTKIFTRMESLILDEFGSYADAEAFLGKQSFFRNMDRRCLRPFVENEVYSVVEDGERRFRTKASRANQMHTYRAAAESIPVVMESMGRIRVRTHHVVGAKATWNPPECREYVKLKIPGALLTESVIDGGEHLVNCELPEATVHVIAEYLTSLGKEADTRIPGRGREHQGKL